MFSYKLRVRGAPKVKRRKGLTHDESRKLRRQAQLQKDHQTAMAEQAEAAYRQLVKIRHKTSKEKVRASH